MSVIERNEHGAIAVNKGVIERLIIEELLEMKDDLILCTKKGKPIKDKPSSFIDPDYYDALELSEKKQAFKVKLYIIVVFGKSVSGIADEVFSRVESIFEILRLPGPAMITVKIKGVMSDQLVKRNIEVIRRNA